jgi:hypothetical protein
MLSSPIMVRCHLFAALAVAAPALAALGPGCGRLRFELVDPLGPGSGDSGGTSGGGSAGSPAGTSGGGGSAGSSAGISGGGGSAGSSGNAGAGGSLAGQAGAGGCVGEPLPVDTTLDGLVPASCVPGALVCDDMEGPPPPEARHFVSAGAIATRTNCDSAHGARSMHVVLPSRTAVAGVTYYQLPTPLATGTLYGREWVRIAALPSNWIDLVEFAYAGGKTSLDVLSDDSIRFNMLTNTSFPSAGPNTTPLGRWFCVTYSIELGAPGRVTLDVDGTRLIDTVVDTYASAYTSVFFGAWVNRGAAGIEFYVDDFVLATQPVGCD